MKDRVKQVRVFSGKNQNDFGSAIGVTAAAVSRWESGDRSVPETAILSICRVFGINETWLRTGAGEMRAAPSREAEIGRMVRELMAERPDSFKSSLITALLRLAPEEWALLEKIYDSIKESPEG